jgi:ubiquinone/menaquinone biosynthesis C-methylase UbiE
MCGDPYAKSAKRYDTFVEPFARRLRKIGMKMTPLFEGMSVLDIGCGTGSHLKIYENKGCKVTGIDSSPTMLDVARVKLNEGAELHLGNANRMPFPDASFDLVLTMFLLHQVEPQIRSSILKEAVRVMKRRGRFLAIDYHPGPAHFPQGWLYRSVSFFMELFAGWAHFRNYRDFMKNGGLLPLIAKTGLSLKRKMIVGGGVAGIYLLGLKGDKQETGVRRQETGVRRQKEGDNA